jgi:hypothetical protein
MTSLLRSLIDEIYYLNDRIICGDVSSPKHALIKAKTIVSNHRSFFEMSNAKDVFLDVSISSDGLITLSYSFISPEGQQYLGNNTPRRR